MPSPSAALRRSRAFALSATPDKLAGGGATTADYVLDLVSQPARDTSGEKGGREGGRAYVCTAPHVVFPIGLAARPTVTLQLYTSLPGVYVRLYLIGGVATAVANSGNMQPT